MERASRAVSLAACARRKFRAAASDARSARGVLVRGDQGRHQGTRPLTALRASGTALSWTASNLACEAFGRAHPDQYLRIRYEDLVRAPSEAMQGLVAKLLPGVSWNPAGIGDNANRHQLYGNRMRARCLSLADIKEDSAWRTDMPAALRGLAAALTWPLRERYGYC